MSYKWRHLYDTDASVVQVTSDSVSRVTCVRVLAMVAFCSVFQCAMGDVRLLDTGACAWWVTVGDVRVLDTGTCVRCVVVVPDMDACVIV